MRVLARVCVCVCACMNKSVTVCTKVKRIILTHILPGSVYDETGLKQEVLTFLVIRTPAHAFFIEELISSKTRTLRVTPLFSLKSEQLIVERRQTSCRLLT